MSIVLPLSVIHAHMQRYNVQLGLDHAIFNVPGKFTVVFWQTLHGLQEIQIQSHVTVIMHVGALRFRHSLMIQHYL